MNKSLTLADLLVIRLYKLKEEKEKIYQNNVNDHNLIYIFNNYEEFKNYFIENNCEDVDDETLKLCIFSTNKKGSVIALKGLCDHLITKYNLIKENENINRKVLVK